MEWNWEVITTSKRLLLWSPSVLIEYTRTIQILKASSLSGTVTSSSILPFAQIHGYPKINFLSGHANFSSLCQFVYLRKASVILSEDCFFCHFRWWVESCAGLNWSAFTFQKLLLFYGFSFLDKRLPCSRFSICPSIPADCLVFISVYRVFWFHFSMFFCLVLDS